jgi:hypothetical protein
MRSGLIGRWLVCRSMEIYFQATECEDLLTFASDATDFSRRLFLLCTVTFANIVDLACQPLNIPTCDVT